MSDPVPQHHQRPVPLGSFNKDKKHSEPERWICIYPAYLNSLKSLSQGRLIAKKHCLPNPTYLEIKDVLSNAGVGWTPIVENKQYPRERSREMEFRGRIRVQLKNDDGSLFSEKFQDRESILKYLCETIPQLKSRTTKQASGQENQSSISTNTKKGKKKK